VDPPPYPTFVLTMPGAQPSCASGHQNQDIPKLAVTVSLFSLLISVVQLYNYNPIV